MRVVAENYEQTYTHTYGTTTVTLTSHVRRGLITVNHCTLYIHTFAYNDKAHCKLSILYMCNEKSNYHSIR